LAFACADCTGHGVPGAFMSVLGISALNDIVNNYSDLPKANNILEELRNKLISSLHQTGKEGEAQDGMDIAFCILTLDTNLLQYSGAYNPLYLVRNNNLIETKADKMPIGIYHLGKKYFTNHEIQLQKDDCIYIFSDGYVDQFGGPKGKKFKNRQFKEVLKEISDKTMGEQKSFA